MSKQVATYNTFVDFVTETKGMCKGMLLEATWTCQSHLILMEQIVSRAHRTRNIISQIRSKEDDNFSAGSTNTQSKRNKEVFLILWGLLGKVFDTLSDEDTDYQQQKVSELETEKSYMLKVAKEQRIVVRSLLQTVNSISADVSAHEMQLSESLNLMQKQMKEKGRIQVMLFCKQLF
jgi:hypothetical protein